MARNVHRKPKTLSSAINTPTAASAVVAQKVFDIPELYEMIISNLDSHDLLGRLHTDAKLIQAAKGSKKLQRKLCLTQEPEIEDDRRETGRFGHSTASWEPNLMLLMKPPPTAAHIPKGKSPFGYFRLSEDSPPYRIVLSHRLTDKESPWVFQFIRNVGPGPAPHPVRLLTPAYLSMYLSDRATPIIVRVMNSPTDEAEAKKMDPGRREHFFGVKTVWIPAGKTLGDVIHYFEIFYTGGLSRADVLNGICQFKWSHLSDPKDELWVRKLGWWVLHVSGEWRSPLSRGRGYGPKKECREMEAMRSEFVKIY
ncbi:hypothetical protein PRZ48_009005 [Zasmidium cellare]|uniref:Uncharacterized protein n=1 Tax=Zasmidium cellare TaxID=395010 RepID=A0ABR0EIA6_ZASCE|nr:hypothetical protein PRZ48_009005 [Zasmidium cellare]